MKEKYNWGILAPGRIARQFATSLSHTERGKLYAVASTSRERAASFASEFGAEKYYENYDALWADKNIDVIYIASPHHLHYHHSLACLAHGKHVLCEKPITINAPQFEKLSKLAEEKGLFYMDAFWTRFLPAIEKTLSLCKKIEPIRYVRADFGFLAPYDLSARTFNPDLGGGSLLDIGIYPAFLGLLVLGYPDSITASAVLGETGVDESMSAIFKYKSGALAALSSTFMATTHKQGEIAGKGGRIILSPRAHRPDRIDFYPEGGKVETFHFNYRSLGYEYEAEEVMDCLDKGLLQSPRLPHSFTLGLMNVLDDIRTKIGLRYPPNIEKI